MASDHMEMDYIWTIWKCLCCSNKRTAFRSALFVKKYICCARNIYIPCSASGFSRRRPFFVDGEVVSSFITGQFSMFIEDSHFKYHFKYDKTEIESLQKEETYAFAVCCGCPVRDPEDTFPVNPRSAISKIIPRKDDDDHQYVLALQKLMELNSHTPVALFWIRTWGQGDPLEVPRMVDWMWNALKSVKVRIPMLKCTIAEESYKPWVELVEFQHLSLWTKEKVEITEKMLNCGFLNITAVISNPEELNFFKGFGLTIGLMSKNGFTWDRLFQEIELWKNGTPSSLECFGLFDDGGIPSPSDLLDRLTSYSINGKLIIRSPQSYKIDVIMLDDENDAAIMHVFDSGVCFVRGGWEKWEEVFFAIAESFVQFSGVQ